ncbi:COP9 signalosome complex subunit 5 [Puccinia sorghi]|uniref:COP9 signalosome complex subunit 5 n=1 Tax=Puccinia sorghi TaxID=27349 RepID=A0A0L6VBP8_9BASI|nr:COP9 signalosome complex subunit 5 [Puccinia sorghi]
MGSPGCSDFGWPIFGSGTGSEPDCRAGVATAGRCANGIAASPSLSHVEGVFTGRFQLGKSNRTGNKSEPHKLSFGVAMDPSKMAQKTFELENCIQPLEQDQIFRYNAEEQKAIQKEAKWKKDPHYFKKVRVSGVALIKMVMHARSGGQYEIMGLMQASDPCNFSATSLFYLLESGRGALRCLRFSSPSAYCGKIDGDTFVVMDSFALPVQGTETRVNAASEANEYMVEFLERSKNVGRLENVVGWYHSHPGYGCWLSGIDVSTQFTNQTYTDPFVAIVIDPNRTISAGRVDIGAFRTFPEGYTPPSLGKNKDDEYQSIPLSKIEDFGAHANSYYPLEIEHFKSGADSKILDLLWERYWVMTLSQNTWLSNRVYTTSQMQEMTDKLTKSTNSLYNNHKRNTLKTLIPTSLRTTIENENNHASGSHHHPDAPLANSSHSNTPPHHHSELFHDVLKDVEKLEVENLCES